MKAAKQLSKALSGKRAPITTSDPGFTLHKLRHDDFHVICGMREEYKTPMPDYTGDRTISGFVVGRYAEAPDGQKGPISGFAMDGETITPFARVNGRLYHVSTLKRA